MLPYIYTSLFSGCLRLFFGSTPKVGGREFLYLDDIVLSALSDRS